MNLVDKEIDNAMANASIKKLLNKFENGKTSKITNARFAPATRADTIKAANKPIQWGSWENGQWVLQEPKFRYSSNPEIAKIERDVKLKEQIKKIPDKAKIEIYKAEAELARKRGDKNSEIDAITNVAQLEVKHENAKLDIQDRLTNEKKIFNPAKISDVNYKDVLNVVNQLKRDGYEITDFPQELRLSYSNARNVEKDVIAKQLAEDTKEATLLKSALDYLSQYPPVEFDFAKLKKPKSIRDHIINNIEKYHDKIGIDMPKHINLAIALSKNPFDITTKAHENWELAKREAERDVNAGIYSIDTLKKKYGLGKRGCGNKYKYINEHKVYRKRGGILFNKAIATYFSDGTDDCGPKRHCKDCMVVS